MKYLHGLARWLVRTAVILGIAGLGVVAWRVVLSPQMHAPATTVPRSVSTAPPSPGIGLGHGITATAPAHAAATVSLGRSVPVRIHIPAIAVDAPVTTVGLSNGNVGVPPLNSHNLAGWFDHTVTPGENGPSFIDGHVDSYTGPSVFYRLKNLHKGDAISVTRADGQTVTFHVTWVQITSKTAFPWDTVLANTPYPALRIATCGGPFNSQTGHYADNIIVYAN